MLREVEVRELSVGMYVAELDRPWLETPFPVQGFYINTSDDVQRIADFCRTVKVDPRRYHLDAAGGPESLKVVVEAVEEAAVEPAAAVGHPLYAALTEAGCARPVSYEDVSNVEEELQSARKALESGADMFAQLWQALTSRRAITLANIRAAVNPLVESLLRNKDALVTLMRVRHLDRNTHEHCMALAVWGALLGRQLGLPPEQIKSLALGCSLVDIGKVRLPKQLLYRPGPLRSREYPVVQAHVDYSLEMLSRMGECPEELAQVVRWHHERMDGSGYPDRLEGSRIPLFARIAGIVDSYDAMISARTYAPTCSSFQALVELQDHCPRLFQRELVDLFAQAVGLFPNGALVELSSGEVGVVCGQNPGRRLRPKVMLILDASQRRRDTLTVIDLKTVSEEDLWVSRELARDEYGIDAQEYFL